MDLRGLRPSPLELPAHPHSPRRNQYTPPVVEVAGIEPASEALPTRRNYSHVLNYGGGLADFQQRPSPQSNIFSREFKFTAMPKPSPKNQATEHLKRENSWKIGWLRGQDLNLRPSGYEPDELPTAPPRVRMHSQILAGAGDESRTRDLNLGKVALYQLSYSRISLHRTIDTARCEEAGLYDQSPLLKREGKKKPESAWIPVSLFALESAQ